MDLPAELKTKSTEEIEAWFLGRLSAPDLSVDVLIAALLHLRATHESAVADALAAKLHEVLAEKGDRTGGFELLLHRCTWHERDAGFREVCLKAAADLYKDRIGLILVKNVGFENQAIHLNECLRRLICLTQLVPGVFVVEKTWGFGVVKRIDEFYQKVVVDFDKKADHPMSFAYAGERLEIVGDDHLMSRRRKNPEVMAALVKDNPAEVVRLALRSYGPMSVNSVKDILVGTVLQDAEWKGFWDAARKALKNDPLIEIPSKRNDLIKMLARKKEYDGAWFEGLKADRDIDDIFRKINELDAAGLLPTLTEEQKLVLTQQVGYIAHAGSGRDFGLVARALMTRKYLALPAGTVDWTGYTASLFTKESFLKAATTLSARDLGALVPLMAEFDAVVLRDLLLSLIPVLSLPVLNETMDFLLKTGHQPAVLDVIRPLTASKQAPIEILYWLCRHTDVATGPLGLKPYDLVTQALEALGREAGYATLRAQNQLRDLFEEKGWVEGMMKHLDERQRGDLLRRVNDAKGWDPTARRSLMARMIKLYPDLQKVMDGHAAQVAAQVKAALGRFTSWRSYRLRQEQYRKLIEEDVPKNTKEIAVARSYGDLRENAEYKFAKEHQRLLLLRQDEMEKDLKEVTATDFAGFPTDKGGVGTCVAISRPDGRVQQFSILGEWDGDELLGVISSMSSIAKSVEGRKAGDEVFLPGDQGADPCKIVAVSALPDEVKAWIRG